MAFGIWVIVSSLDSCPACELCAIYNASGQHGDNSGFLLTLAEEYISSHTLQNEGQPYSAIPFFNNAYLDTSFSHVIPGYNFSSRFGINLNVPIVYRAFRRTQFLTTPNSGTVQVDEEGTIKGLGDAALIGRWSVVQKNTMKRSLNLNLLAGVKFPTGDTGRLDDEVNDAKADLAAFGSGHLHGAVGGIHQHDLTLGSGSYDGVFGLTSNLRWTRWFLNNQLQYYLRSEGHSYKFGNLLIVSGGPGIYVPLGEESTFSLQANAFYETSARDRLIGQVFEQTGTTAWYVGPILNFTFGEHFSANAEFDWPLRIYNHGLQTVLDYRVRGGFSWRF